MIYSLTLFCWLCMPESVINYSEVSSFATECVEADAISLHGVNLGNALFLEIVTMREHSNSLETKVWLGTFSISKWRIDFYLSERFAHTF